MKKANQLLFLLSFFMLTACGQSNNNKTNSKTNGIVVLELFTSQGCSSCPPADKILAKYALQHNPNIIPLAFHIDYWDRLGWKDPFSKAEFSNRQREYAQKFNSDNVYTPQLIINGSQEIIGSDEKGIEKLVTQQSATKNEATLAITSASILENQLMVEYKTTTLENNQVINLALVKKKELTNIKRGENSGLKQTSYNIVYDFKTTPLDKKGDNKQFFDFKKDWLPSDFFVVAYIQNKKDGKIQEAVIQEIN